MRKLSPRLQVEELEPRTLLAAAPLAVPPAPAEQLAPAPAQRAPLLIGTVHGHFTLRHPPPGGGAAYTLKGEGTVGVLGRVSLAGSVRAAGTSGRLTLANAKGALTLALEGAAPASTGPAAGQFAYQIVRATGAYRHLAGGGAIDLHLGAAAQFALVLRPGVGPQAIPPPGIESGIAGVVMEGPISPVSRPGEPNSRPVPGAIVSVQPAGGGAEITRQTADGQGRFQIALPPGAYRVVPLPPNPGQPFPRGTPQDVTVAPRQVLELTLMMDTGIR